MHNPGRRQFIKHSLTLTTAAAISPSLALATANAGAGVWLSAQGRESGDYGVGWLTDNGSDNPAHTQAVGFRGHGVLQLDDHRALVVSRKPGQWLAMLDLTNGSVIRRQQCPDALFFEGHACTDGERLYTSESHLRTGAGRVGIYDLSSLERQGEWSLGAIGPHELRLMPDGKTLVVAIGGLITRDGEVLNAVSMASSLRYISADTGELLENVTLNEAKASIRHLDVAADGTVAFGLQVQRNVVPHNRLIPLTGSHQRGQAPKLFEAPDNLVAELNDYVGSVAVCEHSRMAGFTSPRGNLAVFWHLDSGQLAGWHQLHDVCGIALDRDQRHFVLTSSGGQLRQLDAISLREDTRLRRDTGITWDNHLTYINLPG